MLNPTSITEILGAPAEEWMRSRNCTTAEADTIYFPAEGSRTSGTKRQRAVRNCNACPVQAECADYAIRQDEAGMLPIVGIWAGVYVPQSLAGHGAAIRDLHRIANRPIPAAPSIPA